ncbi:acyltransferase domain-containing protein [Streptomyces fimicarius]|uniref:acyltransferase domain-containing protein n=1 Tax=Streptomyces griseus TaxID=1911 RepID=UPI0036BF1662
MTSRTAFLFPGQGAYLPGILAGLADRSAVQDAVAEVDESSRALGCAPMAKLLFDPAAPPIDKLVRDRPADLDMALFAMNMAAYAALSSVGARPDVLAGHSFGELAAVTAAGAVTVADAVQFLHTRTRVLGRAVARDGGMLALSTDARRGRHLVGLLDDPLLALAVDNGPSASVISGPAESLNHAAAVARSVGIEGVQVNTAYPFHSPMLYQAARSLARETADMPLKRPDMPVYSALLNGYLTDPAQLREVLDHHLVWPVAFRDGMLRLHREGVKAFVEAGARSTLTRLVESAVPPGVIVCAPFDRRRTPSELVEILRSAKLDVADRPARDTAPPMPDTTGPDTSAREAAAPEPASSNSAPDRAQLLSELRSLYADYLGYPVEMFEDDVDLEADLGVDSIKQVAAFQKVRSTYGLANTGEGARISAYTTLEDLATFILSLDRTEGTT